MQSSPWLRPGLQIILQKGGSGRAVEGLGRGAEVDTNKILEISLCPTGGNMTIELVLTLALLGKYN